MIFSCSDLPIIHTVWESGCTVCMKLQHCFTMYATIQSCAWPICWPHTTSYEIITLICGLCKLCLQMIILLANGITTWSKLGWGVSNCWSGFPLEHGTETWDWNVGLERATGTSETGTCDWNMGLDRTD